MYLLDLSLGSIPFKIVPLCSDTSIPAPLPLLERVLEVLFSKPNKNILRFPLDLPKAFISKCGLGTSYPAGSFNCSSHSQQPNAEMLRRLSLLPSTCCKLIFFLLQSRLLKLHSPTYRLRRWIHKCGSCIQKYYFIWTRDSVGIAICYGVNGPEIKSRWDLIFCTRPNRPCGTPSLRFKRVPDFFFRS